MSRQTKTTNKNEQRVLTEPKNTAPTLRREMFYLLRKVLVLGAIIAVIGIAFFGVTRNTDSGMNPAVKHGDLVFYYRMDKQYKANDILALQVNDEVQLCRVVSVAGDTVAITEAGLLINGASQQEPEVRGETLSFTEGITFPLTLQEGQVFLLGDNREAATDSRLYGAIEVKDTLGKVMLIMRRRSF